MLSKVFQIFLRPITNILTYLFELLFSLLVIFAKLKLLGTEQTYARSLVGLQAQIEALVMTNNLAKFGML